MFQMATPKPQRAEHLPSCDFFQLDEKKESRIGHPFSLSEGDLQGKKTLHVRGTRYKKECVVVEVCLLMRKTWV